jgi:hypothetical protein
MGTVAGLMADPSPMPTLAGEALFKIRSGQPLTPEESAYFLNWSLVRVVEELEHICEALRLTPQEEESGGG